MVHRIPQSSNTKPLSNAQHIPYTTLPRVCFPRLALQVPGGSADRCGQIAPLDTIVSVDGNAVRGRSLQELRDLILGAPGSNISLTFMRDSTPNGPARTPELFHVHLMRGMRG
jgi:hypothetical protein